MVQPTEKTETATSLINGGADVLFQNTDSAAVLKTAEEKGKRAFGWDSDMTAYGPRPTWRPPSSTGVRTTSRPRVTH